MTKFLLALALFFSCALTIQVASADPSNASQMHKKRDKQYQSERQYSNDSDNRQERRRAREEREERGVRRLQQHKWQAGYTMPQHYRGDAYKVDFKEHKLPKPDRNQQWYKVNNDYILVESDSKNIIQILGF